MSGPLTRGFLFADLRHYTSFVERHGDAAASALLDRYRGLVRSAVAQYGGAEVKTEGDSFFVVFPSASSAVRCGLDIVQAAEVATREHPVAPVRVGIGVHAGETVAGSEGYVGSAVNLAARVCAQARAGEVVVTDTVRSLTRTSLRVGFKDSGRRRLKGYAEPAQLYLVSPAAEEDRSPSVARDTRWAGRAVAGVALVALLAVAGVGAARWFTTPPPREPVTATDGAAATPSPPSASATPQPVRPGEESAGTYTTVNFQPPFTFSIDAGWKVWYDDADVFWMDRVRGGSAVVAYRANVVYTGPCPESPTQRIDPGSDAFLDWLEAHPHLEAGNPRPAIVDGVTGIEIDVTGGEIGEACAGDGPERDAISLVPIARFFPGGISVSPGEEIRFIVVDLPAGTVSFALIAAPGFAEEFGARSDVVMDSIDFTDPGG
jgi:class 3 adenylate cyclase